MNTPPPPSFQLTTEPWVPCELDNGEVVDLSLIDVFTRTSTIRRLVGDSPQQRYALLRILLVILWRAHLDSPELDRRRGSNRFGDWWSGRFEHASQDSPDERAIAYLERHAERFDLFGPTPFMQVADLATESGHHSDVRRLVPEAESDYFTQRAGGGLDELSFAEAARWLITVQAWDYSGIKSGACGDPRVRKGKGYPIGTGWTGMTGGVMFVGENLAQTLLLNTVAPLVFDRGARDDLPPWERDPDTSAERASTEPTGPCDLLTWQSRRIRLFTDGARVTGALVANGDRIPNAGANIESDPMTPHRFSSNKSTKALDIYYPRPHDGERTIWRSLQPLLMREGVIVEQAAKKDRPPKAPATIEHLHQLRRDGMLPPTNISVELISVVYGAQSSSVQGTVHAQLELPVHVLDGDDPAIVHTILAAARQAQECATTLGQFAGQLLQAAGGDYEFRNDRANELLNSLEPRFREWLAELRVEHLDRRLEHWYAVVERETLELARMLVNSAGPRALIGREVAIGDRQRSISAGNSYAWLQRRLRDLLPRRTDRLESADVI